MNDLLEQFVIEGRELTQAAGDDLLALARNQADPARIDAVFRAVHTLKGSAALLDFAAMGKALHAAEDLMSALRDGTLAPVPSVLDVLLGCIDATERWIEAIATTGAWPEAGGAEAAELSRKLRAKLDGVGIFAGPTDAEAAANGAGWLPALCTRAAAALARAAGRELVALRYTPAPDCFFMGDDPMATIRAVPDLVALQVGAVGPWPDPFDPFACNLVIEAVSAAPIERLRGVFRLVRDQVAFAAVPAPSLDRQPIPAALEGRPATEPAPGRQVAARSLRIDAGRIDAMADLVGELIVAKNSLAHEAAELGRLHPGATRALVASHAQLERLVGELHRAVASARLVPLAHGLRRLPGQVRDLATRLGKQAVLEIRGAEIEADKAIVDGLFEPLLHLLRNALDHGIEPADARRAAGKPEIGRLELVAGHAAGRIVLLLSDDGAGIDAARVRETARQKGLVDPATLATMDDAAVMDLLFAPGFSTATTVSEVSGRGVGLDAVRSRLQGLGGSVTVASRDGAGTMVTLAVPQSVVLGTVFILYVGAERFGVPMDAVAETIRVPRDAVQPVGAGMACVHRGQTLPVLQLAALLELPSLGTATPRPLPSWCTLVVTGGAAALGLEVDGFGDRMEVVLRPLTGLLATVPHMLGSVLLGDGTVLMVLDLPSLIERWERPGELG